MIASTPSTLTNSHTPVFGLEPGPITEVHAFWLAGMSCDGCSIAAVGAQHPSVEQLVSGAIPGLPTVILHHPVLATEAGETFIGPYRLAKQRRARQGPATNHGLPEKVSRIDSTATPRASSLACSAVLGVTVSCNRSTFSTWR